MLVLAKLAHFDSFPADTVKCLEGGVTLSNRTVAAPTREDSRVAGVFFFLQRGWDEYGVCVGGVSPCMLIRRS